MNHKRLVSVIIPCFNQGAYLDETLNSVFAQSYRDIEIILVDDGSTDPQTVERICSLNHERLRIYRTKNQGVSNARNYAISASHGDYILPLDGDDKIDPTYIEKAMAVITAKGPRTVVYCEAAVFGATNVKWKLPSFSLNGILKENMIFCSALFSRKLFKRIGGYNPNMRTGWEDWDFWLSAVEQGANFYRLPEVLFFYRMVKKSRNASLDVQRMKAMYSQLFQNHRKLFLENIEVILDDYVELKEQDRRKKNQFSAKLIRKTRRLFRLNVP